MTRGERNNNPGNIRLGPKWQGLAAEQPDREFCTFATPELGIRALALTLYSYGVDHKLNTVRGIINRWAPPVENNTDAYVNAVSKDTGFAPDQPIDTATYPVLVPLVKAIIHHENGEVPYSASVILAGVNMALSSRGAQTAPGEAA